ncbi:MAG: hypothetical protein JWM44_4482 [Bacilli bacterium]|nr:hypothetical protein [Bacilli bacterium]
MNPKNEVFKIVAAIFGGILIAGSIGFIICNPSTSPNPIIGTTSKVDSAKLVASVPIKPVKIDGANYNEDGTPTTSLDSQIRAKQAHINQSIHRYDYEGMIGKPWRYYKVVDDKLSEIPNDETLIPIMKQWDKFILSIRDVEVTAYPDSAGINITDNKGTRHYKLKHAEPQKYLLDNGQSKLLLVTHTSLVCELYFIFGNDAASVSNMNWEMENGKK